MYTRTRMEILFTKIAIQTLHRQEKEWGNKCTGYSIRVRLRRVCSLSTEYLTWLSFCYCNGLSRFQKLGDSSLVELRTALPFDFLLLKSFFPSLRTSGGVAPGISGSWFSSYAMRGLFCYHENGWLFSWYLCVDQWNSCILSSRFICASFGHNEEAL
jgi:hypothetical protein